MKYVSASEANRNFSALLGLVSAGEEIVVTSHGKPVAKIAPLSASEDRRAAARAALMQRLEGQKPRGVAIDWSREDLYEREF